MPSSSKRGKRILEGQVAIITGATGGVGEATAWRFAEEGANVVVHSSGSSENSKMHADKITNEIVKAGHQAVRLCADVSSYSEVKRLVDSVIEKWGKVSAVVAYAGLRSSIESWQQDPLELDDEDLLSAVEVDFLGSYHFIRAVHGYMKKERYGKIVLTSSSPTIYGDEAGYRFVLAKDLNRITVKSLATKLMREDGIYLNAIAPGTIDTASNRLNYEKKEWSSLVRAIPAGRPGEPEDIANVALFLCSRMSDYVVGQTIVVDGGEVRL